MHGKHLETLLPASSAAAVLLLLPSHHLWQTAGFALNLRLPLVHTLAQVRRWGSISLPLDFRLEHELGLTNSLREGIVSRLELKIKSPVFPPSLLCLCHWHERSLLVCCCLFGLGPEWSPVGQSHSCQPTHLHRETSFPRPAKAAWSRTAWKPTWDQLNPRHVEQTHDNHQLQIEPLRVGCYVMQQ